MISLNALSSRRSQIGEVLRQVVSGCSSRRTMYHHSSSPFSACDSQSIGSDKPNEVCLSTKDATSFVGCNSGLHAGKRSEGKVSLPLCSLTIWYYHYALTLHIAKPDPVYAWHSELNTSLGTTTRNHDSEPTKSIRKYDVLHMIVRWLGNSQPQSRLYLHEDNRTSYMRYTVGKLFSCSFRSCEQILSSTSVQKSCVKCLPYRWCGYLTPGCT